MVTCEVCPRHCALEEGQRGFCRARVARGGKVVCQNYGRVTSLALDPIEKKPLRYFHPGSQVLSVGSYGCNLRCSFCQNHDISQDDGRSTNREMSPQDLVASAQRCQDRGNIGIAFTYNEPAVGWEFVRDTARLARSEGLVGVMVTNGCFCEGVGKALLPFINAYNIDLKCFTPAGYKALGGDLETVKATIRRALSGAHVEVTTLVVPGLSDGEEDMERQAAWLASLSPDLPLHLSRYYPRWRASGPPTPTETLHRLRDVARRHLARVELGNI